MAAYNLTYKPFGERAILIEWPQVINEAILEDIINFKEKILNFNIESLVELKSAYCSLLISYDIFYKGFESESGIIDKIYNTKKVSTKTEAILWKIPVCYDACFGVDLEVISKEKGLTKEQIITLHSASVYTVYFIGFLPGFLYLGGLNEKLHIPRKSTPRLQIKKGSVAIGGNQTGVYPNESPGGWNIIGNTPISFFDVSKDKPCFAKAGDGIVFHSISVKEHADIMTLMHQNTFKLESEVMSG